MTDKERIAALEAQAKVLMELNQKLSELLARPYPVILPIYPPQPIIQPIYPIRPWINPYPTWVESSTTTAPINAIH